MPDGDGMGGSTVDLSGVEQNLKEISDNLGTGDKKLFTECAMRLYCNCDFEGNAAGKSAAQLAQQAINNALVFLNAFNKAKNKYFPDDEED